MKTTKHFIPTPEERRMDRELMRYVRTLDMESKGALLVVARELIRRGTMNEMLFAARAI